MEPQAQNQPVGTIVAATDKAWIKSEDPDPNDLFVWDCTDGSQYTNRQVDGLLTNLHASVLRWGKEIGK